MMKTLNKLFYFKNLNTTQSELNIFIASHQISSINIFTYGYKFRLLKNESRVFSMMSVSLPFRLSVHL